jgi:hypothetical protein
MQSIVQILKINESRSGSKEGRPWQIQDAECVILKDTGEVDQVGVLMLPKDLQSAPGQPCKVQPGVYLGAFVLRANMASRRIEAQLTGLQPYSVKTPVKPGAA